MIVHTLVLLRHAKAEGFGRGVDLDRALTARGRADATAAGLWLAAHQLAPEVVVCSPSRRTRQTWHAVAAALTGSVEVHYEADAYDGSAEDLLALVRRRGGAAGVVLLIGHNPTISELSARLDPGAASDVGGLRTSGIAVHTAETAWPDWTAAPRSAVHTARGALNR